MLIQLDNIYYLKSSAKSYDICIKTNGFSEYKGIAFYPTLTGALNGYVNMKLRESKATNFKELRKDLEKIHNDILKITNEINGVEKNIKIIVENKKNKAI